MAIDLGDLVRGTLTYAVREPALDDVRFERVRRGFGDHFLLSEASPNRFHFERGEGYLKVGRFDAFGWVDSGTVERLRVEREAFEESNVVAFAPLYGWLRFSLNLRVTFLVWAFVLLFAWMAIGGDWMAWLVGVIAIWIATVVMVQWSLKRKLRHWLARESWN
jgi:hypothetical protein